MNYDVQRSPRGRNSFIWFITLIELERDLELERRRAREFQDAAREREKEYQKFKVGSLEVPNMDHDP